MKILITGASGYIGGAAARAAAAAGHEVIALAHNAATRDQALAAGFTPVAGDLADAASLARNARAADGVIHAGFTGGPTGGATDEAAARAIAGALEGSRRPFVYTSGVWVLGATGAGPADEDAPLNPIALIAWRGPLERWLTGAVRRGVGTVIIRPGIAYGNRGGIPGMMARGELPLVGDGSQRWSVVHVDDLARLYVAAVERAAPGAILHGVGGVITAAALAAACGAAEPKRAGMVEARATLGDFAEALALDQNVDSSKTRALLGWTPRRLPAEPVAAASVAAES